MTIMTKAKTDFQKLNGAIGRVTSSCNYMNQLVKLQYYKDRSKRIRLKYQITGDAEHFTAVGLYGSKVQLTSLSEGRVEYNDKEYRQTVFGIDTLHLNFEVSNIFNQYFMPIESDEVRVTDCQFGPDLFRITYDPQKATFAYTSHMHIEHSVDGKYYPFANCLYSPRKGNIIARHAPNMCKFELVNEVLYTADYLGKLRNFVENTDMYFHSVSRVDPFFDGVGIHEGIEDCYRLSTNIFKGFYIPGRRKLTCPHTSNGGTYYFGSRSSDDYLKCYKKGPHINNTGKSYIVDYWEQNDLLFLDQNHVSRIEATFKNGYINRKFPDFGDADESPNKVLQKLCFFLEHGLPKFFKEYLQEHLKFKIGKKRGGARPIFGDIWSVTGFKYAKRVKPKAELGSSRTGKSVIKYSIMMACKDIINGDTRDTEKLLFFVCRTVQESGLRYWFNDYLNRLDEKIQAPPWARNELFARLESAKDFYFNKYRSFNVPKKDDENWWMEEPDPFESIKIPF